MDRQKVLLIFAGAWISAALLTWFLYAATKVPRAEKTVAILAAAHDMPSGTRLQKGDLKTIRVPEKDMPKTAILDEKLALDRPLLYPVNTNEPITTFKIASATGAEGLPSAIEIGKRAISVPITDTSGVAGLIQPRAHVDVLFTRPGSMTEAVTTTILENVIVLAIGRNTEGTSAAAPAAAVTQSTAARPQSATLLVTPAQARTLELAKNEGKISLALRNPLDHDAVVDSSATTSRALYGDFTPASKADPRSQPKVVVQKVVETPPPPPPKPRVVEVFRGDKHVQERFQ
jgi:pilus assembly protein CpaB